VKHVAKVANMADNTKHIPKQAESLLEGSRKVDVYESTGGTVSADFASHNLTLIPRIPLGSIIHDNACGPGTVSRAICASSPPDVTLHATDIDQVFLDYFQVDVDKNNWPVSISNQAQESLKFEDAYFTHSITNLGVFFAKSGGLDGAKEIYRTLKPSGTAIANCWEHITWLPAFFATNAATRPGVKFPAPPVSWADGKQIKKVMLEAGFKEEDMKVEKSEAWAKTTDLRSWAEKSWAFLGGMGGWHEGDEAKWEQAVDTMVENMMAQPGTKTVGEEVWMRASQWVVVATK